MKTFLLDHYLWIKALHVIAVIAWMSGIFYLPRLFVYHTQTQPETAEYERFATMERKLLKIIMNPAMVMVLVRAKYSSDSLPTLMSVPCTAEREALRIKRLADMI